MKKFVSILPILVILASFAAAFYFYPQLPGKVASHWNASGEVDGYMSKFWGTFLMPGVMAGMLLVFWLIPKIDPRKQNIREFFDTFQTFTASIFLFFGYVYALAIWWNLDGRFNLAKFLVPAMAALFYFIGDLVGKARPNWFIGIRTPWTLENETVWNTTHALGGKLYKLCAFLALLSFFWAEKGLMIVIIAIVGVSVFLVAYSYVEYIRQRSIQGK